MPDDIKHDNGKSEFNTPQGDKNSQSSSQDTANNAQSVPVPPANKKTKKKKTLFRKIVNSFLYTFIGLFALILLILGFTQTSTFRSILRTQVMSIADSSLNGHVYIGKIEGTIFTSLILTNTSVNMGPDTLLKAGRIEVRLAPLELLLKKIYVRKVLISNTSIKFVKDSLGVLNISRLIPPKKTVDTTKSEFPFTIDAPSVQLQNVSFSMQDFNKKRSTAYYDALTMSDLRIKDIDVSISAFANIKKNEFNISINKIALAPNLNNFTLKEFSGKFIISPGEINLNNLKLITNTSNIKINAGITNFNLFDSTSDFKKAVFKINLLADKFDFASLHPFVTSMKMMQGALYTKIAAEGTFKELAINDIEIGFGKTKIKTKGEVKNLLSGGDMVITASLNGSSIYQPDLQNLFPGLSLPQYNEYGLLRLDKLTFKGSPLNFTSEVLLKTDRGNLSANIKLDLRPADIIYDVDFKTVNFDFSPFTGMQTLLTASGTVKGSGVKPDRMNTKFDLNSSGAFRGMNIKLLNLNAVAGKKLIDFGLNIIKDSSTVDLKGNFNFANSSSPLYKLSGAAKNISIEEFTKDSTLQSNINFSIDAEGKSFNPDSLDLYSTLFINNSVFNGKQIDSTRAIIDIRNLGKEKGRLINIISDLADITVSGKFALAQLGGLLSKESKLVSSIAMEKINKIYPFLTDSAAKALNPPEIVLSTNTKNNKHKNIIDSTAGIDLKYLIELKDFSLASMFIGQDKHLEIDGQMLGTLKNTGDSLRFTYQTKLDYLKYWGGKDVFFISNFNLNFRLNNLLDAKNINDIFSNLNVKAERVFAGTDIKNINFNLRLNRDSSSIRMAAQLENYASARFKGNFRLNDNSVDFLIDTLNVNYEKLNLFNKKRIELTYSKEEVYIKNFLVGNAAGDINLAGVYSQNGMNDLKINVNNLDLGILGKNILQLKPDNYAEGKLNLDSRLTGKSSAPLMFINWNINNIVYKGHKFGDLLSSVNYKEQNLTADIKFIDSTINPGKPALLATATLPMNLSLKDSGDIMPKGRPISAEIKADSFNLAALGNLVPQIKKLKGLFSANFKITGTYDDIIPEGYIKLQDAGFLAEANNLEYLVGLDAKISNNILSLNNLVVQNTPGTDGGGKISINGQAGIRGFEMQTSDFKVSGLLKILGNESRNGTLGAYGDLIISTKGNIELTVDNNATYLKAPIIVKKANVTIPPTPSAYKNSNTAFIYKYKQDTTATAKKKMDFENLIEMAKAQEEKNPAKQTGKQKSPFNYLVDLSFENEATAHFVLSKELNQAMTAVMKGNITYKSINGKQDAQGELTMLEGSTLEFIKTFTALGSIKFEGDIKNPYLDITATYKDYYYSADSSASSNETQVAVKLKIKGPLSELDQSLINKQNNFAVYYGITNINNDVIDQTKDASDAIMFIVTGKFTADLTQSEKSAATGQLSSTATSLAGSVLGGVLNKFAGDYVRSVELRQVGSATKFNLSGRVKKFRYTIGGSTQVFQDISQANIKIEYPIIEELLIRVERKESINDTGISSEMINEFGLKYKFEF